MFSLVLAACDNFSFSQDCLNTIENQGIKANNPGFISSTNIGDFLNGPYKITTLLFFLAGGLIAFYIVSAGIGLMTSQGNPAAVAANKQKIMNALFGVILMFAAYWIVQLAGIILGLPGITDTFPQ